MGVGLRLKTTQKRMAEQTRGAGAGAEPTLGYVVVGAQLLWAYHGERAEACSGWSWHGQQDDHLVT